MHAGLLTHLHTKILLFPFHFLFSPPPFSPFLPPHSPLLPDPHSTPLISLSLSLGLTHLLSSFPLSSLSVAKTAAASIGDGDDKRGMAALRRLEADPRWQPARMDPARSCSHGSGSATFPRRRSWRWPPTTVMSRALPSLLRLPLLFLPSLPDRSGGESQRPAGEGVGDGEGPTPPSLLRSSSRSSSFLPDPAAAEGGACRRHRGEARRIHRRPREDRICRATRCDGGGHRQAAAAHSGGGGLQPVRSTAAGLEPDPSPGDAGRVAGPAGQSDSNGWIRVPLGF